MNLVITFCQILKHESKTFSVIKVLSTNKSELWFFFRFIDFKQFDNCLLVARTSMREHSLAVEFSSNISCQSLRRFGFRFFFLTLIILSFLLNFTFYKSLFHIIIFDVIFALFSSCCVCLRNFVVFASQTFIFRLN